MNAHKGIWRYRDGALPNTLAFAYVFAGQVIGMALLASATPWGWPPGVVLVAHSLVVAAYLIHDMAHYSIFATRRLNLGVGEVMSWLCGSAYAPMARIQRMHMRHHGDIADLALFDPRQFFATAPGWLRRGVYVLEWLYIPAVELIMHYNVVSRPFRDGRYAAERLRVLVVGASRLALFTLLFILSPWALLGYAIAYILFLIALFLADAWAHTYEYYLIEAVEQPVPRQGRDRVYDREHSFSNLISERWPWLNLLNLNFGYHTVHHEKPHTPWHQLPALHREFMTGNSPQILPYRELWRSFCVNRLKRIESEEAGAIGAGRGRADRFLGVHGVSFLSIV